MPLYSGGLRVVSIFDVPRRHYVLLTDIYSEFNYRRDTEGNCVLVNGTEPRPSDDSCPGDDEFWYDRTPYRLIPYSSCEGGQRLDRGAEHRCPGLKGHGFFFWFFVVGVPSALAALIGYWFYRKSGLAQGSVPIVLSS